MDKNHQTSETPLRADAEGNLVIGVREARKNFADLIARAMYGTQRILIERHGKVVAALLGIEDLRVLEAYEDHADVEAGKRADREDDGTRYTTAEVIAAGKAAVAAREAAAAKKARPAKPKGKKRRSA